MKIISNKMFKPYKENKKNEAQPKKNQGNYSK